MDYVSARFACAVVGNAVVGVHGPDDPNDADWTAYLNAGREIMATGQDLCVLAYSLGGGPNSVQRSQVNDLFKNRPQRVAVMLNSALARGAVTALSWFNNRIKAFNLEQVDEACRHLELSEAHTRRVKAALERLREQLLAAKRS
ncbi:MAG: hypothetical protein H6712_11250 [Myxococcales bacterium]|nr:hypothetical protein [Myxococcales bacterium]MCB9714428.1 hypothetical protein [Myxococcales bacterium]